MTTAIARWQDSAHHSVDFFLRYAYDAGRGVFRSEIDQAGRPVSENVHLVALSRMIYGLAYTGHVDEAQRAAAFLSSEMLERDEDGPYFRAVVDLHAPSAAPGLLAVNEQAYGLTGIVALYDVTREPALLAMIREVHAAFTQRFRDPAAGGYHDAYDRGARRAVRTKSYNSTVYVATSFLLELARVDGARDALYRAQVRELADIVARRFLDPSTGWIIENFTDDWHPDWRGWQKQGDSTIGVVGHNFQAAWFLMRAAEFEGGNSEWEQAARAILTWMLGKPGVDRERGGFFDVFRREIDTPMWHTNKSWWQQAEGIMALRLAELRSVLPETATRPVLDPAVEFYFKHFVDRVGGGEFAEVTASGEPVETVWKGQAGKSAYHTVELARTVIGYEATDTVMLGQFVRSWFAAFDRNAPVEYFLARLDETQVEMRFPPNEWLSNPADFSRWYGGIVATYVTASHDLSDLRFTRLSDEVVRVNCAVSWRARRHDGVEDALRVRQEWEVIAGGGQPRIRRYLVMPLEESV